MSSQPGTSTTRRRDDLIVERVHDETLIFDPASQRFTRLNLAGSLLWEALGDTSTVADLAARLEREYTLDPAVARADADAFVQELSSRGLLTGEAG